MLDLLDEYLTACEGGEEVDLAPYEERAGEEAEELRKQVAIVQQIQNIPGLIQESKVGGVFGRFRTLGLLGTGSSSSVYHAHDSELDRDIAIKVFSDLGPGTDRDSIAEARALARLDHSGVVRVYEVGEHEEQAYIAMEHVEGTDLRSVLRAMRALEGSAQPSDAGSSAREDAVARQLAPTAARCCLVALVARALAYCHHEGIVHRDIKPENILIGPDLQPKLIDFGLARSHGPDAIHPTTRLRGTPAYLAPEQVDKKESGASAASDQFALGTMLYELLTLEQPFRSPTLEGTMAKVSAADPLAPRRLCPGLPADAELICLRALARDPDQRYPSMSALADDLEAFVDHRAISIRRPTLLRLMWRGLRRHRRRVFLAASAAVGLGVVIGAIGMALTVQRRARFISDLSEAEAQVPAASEVDEFQDIFEVVQSGWIEGTRLDNTLVGSLHGTLAVDRVEGLWRKAFDRLFAIRTGFERAIEPSVRAEGLAESMDDWNRMAIVASACGPPWKEREHIPRTGTVDLPEGGDLAEYSDNALPGLPILIPVPNSADRLESGLYRFTLVSGGETLETEFFIRALEPQWAPRLVPISPEIASGMMHISAGTVLLDEVGGEHAYQEFSISRKPVSWHQCRQVFTAAELKAVEADSRSQHSGVMKESDPAVLPFTYASEYASRVGARIPTPVELWVAIQDASVDLGAGVQQEWVSTEYYREPSKRFARSYSQVVAADAPIYDIGVGDGYHEEAVVTSTGFRVAYSGKRE